MSHSHICPNEKSNKAYSMRAYIELGRHNNIPRNERKCTLCNLNDIEDEFHFVLKCPV